MSEFKTHFREQELSCISRPLNVFYETSSVDALAYEFTDTQKFKRLAFN